MKLKYFFLILILLFCAITLTGCYDANGIETIAYVIALGIDEGEQNTMKLSAQISVLNNSQGSDSTSQSGSATLIAVECDTINDGISLINTYISKEIDLSHCKVIVFSENLAYKGISENVFTLVNNIQVRPDCNIIISRCDAYDFLQNSNPIIENQPARYYELIKNSSEYTGYVQNIYMSDFYADILSLTSQPTAILGGISAAKASNSSSTEYKAEEIPLDSSSSGIENLGIAVFNNDKMVGELNNIETLCHLIIINELESATITIPSPFDSTSKISFHINLTKHTKKSVDLINGTPYIKCKVFIESYIYSLDQNINLNDIQTIETLNQYIETYLENNIASYLYKTSKDFKSDIISFGNYALPKYSTWQEWVDSDWLNNYENSFFSVDVETKLQSGQLFSKI